MAISKTQPMRSAEIEILDSLNVANDDIQVLKESSNQNAQDIADEVDARISANAAIRADFASADNAIQTQIGDGFSGVTTITSVTGAMSSAIQSISDEIGSGFSEDNTIADVTSGLVDSVEALTTNVANHGLTLDRFKIGSVEVEIEAEGNASSTVTFDAPFADDAKCIVLAQVSTEELLSLFELAVIDCTFSGFSYSISNSDSDAHTVTLGYVAVKVN